MAPDDFNRLFNRFEREAFRLETQPVYLVAEEQEDFALWLAGRGRPLNERPVFREWQDGIRKATTAGRTIRRVRILEEPPTDYQRFEMWAGQWNAAAGEVIHYLARSRAAAIGLPDAVDWWLFDSATLAIMQFDPDGRPLGGDIVRDPVIVAQHRAWRDLAIQHAAQPAEWQPAA
jgi:hypothetical protein